MNFILGILLAFLAQCMTFIQLQGQFLSEWVKENPECKDPRTKKYDKYNKIVMNSMSGGTTEEQADNIEKIVKNVTKAVTIDKYALK